MCIFHIFFIITPSLYLFFVFSKLSLEEKNSLPFKIFGDFRKYFFKSLLIIILIFICCVQVFLDFLFNSENPLAFTLEKIVFIMNWIFFLFISKEKYEKEPNTLNMMKKFYVMSFMTQLIVVLFLEFQVIFLK